MDKAITKLISFSDAGSDFLFRSFVPDVGFYRVGSINSFMFRALPTIIFFLKFDVCFISFWNNSIYC